MLHSFILHNIICQLNRNKTGEKKTCQTSLRSHHFPFDQGDVWFVRPEVYTTWGALFMKKNTEIIMT